jgi:predicted RNA-binding Zn-ribbon protein involved in translation (DUF1610 family)
MDEKQFECTSCGAQLEYNPEAGRPKCPYCGHEEAVEHKIEDKAEAVEELDFNDFLSKAASEEEVEEVITHKCDACYAETTVDPGQTSHECPFCGTQIVTQSSSKKLIKPKSLLPFSITKEKSLQMWQEWIQGLWFAPNKLKQNVKDADKLSGIYIPHWTYDCNTDCKYRGERGDDYYEKNSEGDKVRKTKWRSISGEVYNEFDDVLVIASSGVPEKLATKLPPWDLEKLVPYADNYLSGFLSESYQVDLKNGFDVAKGIMDGEIRHTVRKDIGGDHQRITNMKTKYDDITFKHILLPIWISAYQFNAKVFRFLVNGRTGKVQGERPWSWVKITLAVLTVLAIAGVIGYLSYYYGDY